VLCITVSVPSNWANTLPSERFIELGVAKPNEKANQRQPSQAKNIRVVLKTQVPKI
jgi:hypothetical protein